jgi:tetratricopeptide (TPR) repeat protein
MQDREPAPSAPLAAYRASAAVADGESENRKVAGDAGGGAAVPRAQAQAQIELAAWDPQTPYLSSLRAATDPYQTYLEQRATHGSAPAFFLDCADYFRLDVKDPKLALRILSNLAELDLESAPLVRVLAYRLAHWERFDLAIPLFETALVLRAEEPQSRRDLALALSRAAQPDYPRAIRLLWEVVSRPWDARFPEIEVIALHELNDVLARMPKLGRAQLDLSSMGIEAAFIEAIEVDLRVVLSWDADNTDIDLWVIDPSGETAIYSHPQTRSGGQMSRDFTGGYGPEVYTIKRALPGTYIVKAHYFGDRVQKLTGAVTVQIEFQTDFGGPNTARQAVTRRLEGDEDTLEVGRFVARFGLDTP